MLARNKSFYTLDPLNGVKTAANLYHVPSVSDYEHKMILTDFEKQSNRVVLLSCDSLSNTSNYE